MQATAVQGTGSHLGAGGGSAGCEGGGGQVGGGQSGQHEPRMAFITAAMVTSTFPPFSSGTLKWLGVPKPSNFEG